MLKKKCQICASLPITCFEVPIIGTTELNLTSEEIYKCLCAKAEITEILPNGQHVILDFGNYDKDNNPVEEPIEDNTNTTDDSATIKTVSIVEEVKEFEVEEEIVKTESVVEETVEVKVEETVSIVEEVKEPEVIEEVVKTESIAEETVEKVSENVKNYQVASRNNIKKGNKK